MMYNIYMHILYTIYYILFIYTIYYILCTIYYMHILYTNTIDIWYLHIYTIYAIYTLIYTIYTSSTPYIRLYTLYIGCILLELILGHELFCMCWMSAYDYENIQCKERFQDGIVVAVRALPSELVDIGE